jgi:tetratricopeptide (TPR) repeat protein
MIMRIYTYEEKFNKTIESFEKSILDKNFNTLLSMFLGHLGISYFKTGNTTKSEACLKELLARSRITSVGSPSFFAAAVYAAKGEKENAVQALEKAYSDHEVEMYWLKVEPLFRSLHGDPGFENIVQKIGYK